MEERIAWVLMVHSGTFVQIGTGPEEMVFGLPADTQSQLAMLTRNHPLCIAIILSPYFDYDCETNKGGGGNHSNQNFSVYKASVMFPLITVKDSCVKNP